MAAGCLSEFAMWRCFRTSCGWAGQVHATMSSSLFSLLNVKLLNLPYFCIIRWLQAFADANELYRRIGPKSFRTMTEENLGLEPLGPEVFSLPYNLLQGNPTDDNHYLF